MTGYRLVNHLLFSFCCFQIFHAKLLNWKEINANNWKEINAEQYFTCTQVAQWHFTWVSPQHNLLLKIKMVIKPNHSHLSSSLTQMQRFIRSENNNNADTGNCLKQEGHGFERMRWLYCNLRVNRLRQREVVIGRFKTRLAWNHRQTARKQTMRLLEIFMAISVYEEKVALPPSHYKCTKVSQRSICSVYGNFYHSAEPEQHLTWKIIACMSALPYKP